MAKPAVKKGKKVRTATTTRAKLKEKIAKKRVRILKKPVKRSAAKELKRRDKLIEDYMPFATSIANRVSQTLSSSVDYDEVLCNARIGLLEAAKRFDDGHQVDFKTFAYYRIKGAIYDGLRRSGWIPRSVYSRIKAEEASNDYLRHKAESGDDSDEEYEKQLIDTVNSLASIYVISIDASPDLEIVDESQVDLERRAEFKQIREHMRYAIDSLPEKEKKLIKMYYFQNRTLEEAGEKLELSKSWTSRLHARALDLLFKRIRVSVRGETVAEEEEFEGAR
jgi:RNA polymerase sigma factor for flagellar operon FliA